MTPFLKMHGLGNDFVLFDARIRPVTLTHRQARAIADRRTGIGCDQVIVIENSANGADARMRIFNADGGEAESCGNAARCVARLVMDEHATREVCIDTEGGPLLCTDTNGLVTIDMGTPKFEWRDIPLRENVNTESFRVTVVGVSLPALEAASAVSIGNPHCVLFVEDDARTPVQSLGPAIERHSLFPDRTNVEFVHVLDGNRLRMRVWERGTGMTPACGTGACAAMVAAQRRGLCGTKAEVELDGGSLVIEWQGGDSHIFMTGPTALVYRGEVDLEALS